MTIIRLVVAITLLGFVKCILNNTNSFSVNVTLVENLTTSSNSSMLTTIYYNDTRENINATSAINVTFPTCYNGKYFLNYSLVNVGNLNSSLSFKVNTIDTTWCNSTSFNHTSYQYHNWTNHSLSSSSWYEMTMYCSLEVYSLDSSKSKNTSSLNNETLSQIMTSLVNWKSSLKVSSVKSVVSQAMYDDDDDDGDYTIDFSIMTKLNNATLAQDAANYLTMVLVDLASADLFSSEMKKFSALASYHCSATSLSILQHYDLVKIKKPNEYKSIKPKTELNHTKHVLRLIMLGDWRKGGIQGDVTATQSDSQYTNIAENAADDTNDHTHGLGNEEKHDHDHEHEDHKHDRNRIEYTYQYAIAKSMAAHAEQVDIASVIALGDNFYDDGVASVSDFQWWSKWRYVYNFPSLLNISWYSVLGNHDYGYGEEGVMAQIHQSQHPVLNVSVQYNMTLGTQWKTPATNYSVTFYGVDGSSLTIICVDTTTLAPSLNRCCNEEGGISNVTQIERIENQLSNIEIMLQEALESSPTWLLMAGHYPIYSAGEHGDSSELIQNLQPLIEIYGVDAYICGHDHISEHLRVNNTNYIVAGAGALTDNLGQTSAAELLWYGVGYSAFLSLTANRETLQFDFIDIYGDVVYTTVLINTEAANSTVESNYSEPILRNRTSSPSSGSGNGGGSQSKSNGNPSFDNTMTSSVIIGFCTVGAISCLLFGAYWHQVSNLKISEEPTDEAAKPAGSLLMVSKYLNDIVESNDSDVHSSLATDPELPYDSESNNQNLSLLTEVSVKSSPPKPEISKSMITNRQMLLSMPQKSKYSKELFVSVNAEESSEV